MTAPQHLFANGKLLLTAEYVVLDGATALALPTKFGQSLDITPSETTDLEWTSFDADGKIWFSATFDFDTFKCKKSSDNNVSTMLGKIFAAALHLKYDNTIAKNRGFTPPQYLTPFNVETRLTFPKEWGLGTSSTLITNIARVFKVNPYTLLAATFGGSGYDIACATSESPLLFQLENGVAFSENVTFLPVFAQNLYFVYLGKKQNSKEGIERYNKQKKVFGQCNIETLFAPQITGVTQAFLTETDLKAFEEAIVIHEKIDCYVGTTTSRKNALFQRFLGRNQIIRRVGRRFCLGNKR